MIKKITIYILLFFCFLNMLFWPVNEYEWMLSEDPDMILPLDDKQDVYVLCSIAPLIIVAFFSFLGTNKSYNNKGFITIFFCY